MPILEHRSDQDNYVRQLVLEIVRMLVDESDSVILEMRDDGSQTTLRLQVAPGDTGKVIGKQGRTARSLRTILSAVSMKQRRRYALDIREETR